MERCERKLPLILVGLLAAQCVYYIMSYPLFSFSDEQELISYFLTGQFPWRFFPSMGRIYPLSLLEYYPVVALPVSESIKMSIIYGINSVKIIAFLYIMRSILSGYTDEFFSTCAIFVFYIVLLKYDIVDVSNVVTFPEFTLSVLLVLYVSIYIRAQREDNPILYITAFMLAISALFFKEPVFIIFMTVGGSVFFAVNISRREKHFLCANIFLAFAYVFFYLFVIYPQITVRYGYGVVESWSAFALFYLKAHSFGFVGVVLLCIRLVMVFVFRKKFLQLDTFLTVGVLYAAAFVVLKMHADYYFIPSLIFIYVAMVGYAFLAIKGVWIYSLFTRFRVVLCVTACLLVMIINGMFMNYSNPYALKKMTKELVLFLEESRQAGFSVQPVLPDGYQAHTNAAQVEWHYFVLDLFYKFYAKDAATWPLEAAVAEIDNRLVRNIYIVPPEKARSGNEFSSHQDFVVLGGVFVDMKVHRDFINEITDHYCKFVKHLATQGTRAKDAVSVFASGRELQCRM